MTNPRAHIDIDAVEYAAKNHPTVREMSTVRQKWNDRTGRYEKVEQFHRTRRAEDAKIWGNFTSAEETAAEQLAKGRDAVAMALGVKAQNLTPRVDEIRAAPDSTKQIELERRYWEWCEEAKRSKISVTLTLAIICDGMSLSQAAQTYPQGRDTISRHMYRGIRLYAEMFPKPV